MSTEIYPDRKPKAGRLSRKPADCCRLFACGKLGMDLRVEN